jgi:hypothetical protein
MSGCAASLPRSVGAHWFGTEQLPGSLKITIHNVYACPGVRSEVENLKLTPLGVRISVAPPTIALSANRTTGASAAADPCFDDGAVPGAPAGAAPRSSTVGCAGVGRLPSHANEITPRPTAAVAIATLLMVSSPLRIARMRSFRPGYRRRAASINPPFRPFRIDHILPGPIGYRSPIRIAAGVNMGASDLSFSTERRCAIGWLT